MDTGIVSYGIALPKHRLAAEEVYRVWRNVAHDLLDKLSIGERGVTGPEEDTVTLAAAAGKMALERSGIAPNIFPSQTSIKGLYLTGHWVTNGIGQSGIPLVASCGKNVAKLLLRHI